MKIRKIQVELNKYSAHPIDTIDKSYFFTVVRAVKTDDIDDLEKAFRLERIYLSRFLKQLIELRDLYIKFDELNGVDYINSAINEVISIESEEFSSGIFHEIFRVNTKHFNIVNIENTEI